MEYYLGLDMGTSSVGWAVTDSSYHLLRAKGKDLWGVRLFNEANTAADRRVFRTNRRRLQREKARVGFLRECFADSINQIDPNFYQRLDDSKYFLEDKTLNQPFALFSDKEFTDKDYYQKYPTIFHLRKELIESSEPHDVRLVFLAILNIYKHRGHFLNQNLSDDGIGDLNELYCLLSQDDYFCFPDLKETEEIKSILSSKSISNLQRSEEIVKFLNLDKKSKEAEAVKMICGLTGTISKIFAISEDDEEGQKLKISFRDGTLDEKLNQAETTLSEEDYERLLVFKQIHDFGLLSSIMPSSGSKYLSYARVESYEKHHRDLLLLKKVYKKYMPDKFDEMFRIMRDNNYSAYSGSVNSKIQKERRGGKAKTEDFYKGIITDIAKMPKDEDTEYITNEINKETFLPKQLTNSNGVIPMQVHKMELAAILKNAENYLDFLKVKDETGIAVSQKILDVFSFQIPYYIGPLVNNGDNNAWVVRKEEGKVYPWNFEQKIDVKASSEEFIKRMVNHCTYLTGETVLPKQSLIYQRFMVLNELNNLKINGEDITVELKQDIYNDLFKKGNKVKGSTIIKYLKSRNLIDAKDTPEITGIDGDFVNSLSSLKKFRDVYGVDELSGEQQKMTEQIIYWSTVYGDSRKFLNEKITENFGDILKKEQIKRITSLKFKDWGRLSRQMLTLEGASKGTGEIKSLIGRMWDENLNLMELLSDRFTYLEEINKRVKAINKSLSEITYEDLDELYISAPVRRMTWQTILIIKELYSVLGEAPRKIFVEMARDTDAKKERKDSRKKKFIDLYKSCKDDGVNWSKQIKDTPDERFRSKKLYLYYTQKGRCMYTGEIIELQNLFNDNLYDIDHIYPQSVVKDDSLENNCVLVKKTENAGKSNTFPIAESIRHKQASFWKTLLDGEFITKEKYNRLMRREAFSDDELAQFVNRQIVETRQGTKFIAELFKEVFPDSDTVYVKAGNVSEFRKRFDLLKCRSINDFHHANDAYLNIVVGNVYDVKFTKHPINFIKEYRKDPKSHPYHMNKIFDYSVRRGDQIAWIAENGESIAVVKKMMQKNTPLVTQMNYEVHGGFAEQTIYSADLVNKAGGEGYIPVKCNDKVANINKYGGYSSVKGTYYFLVEFTKGKKRIRKLEFLPLYLKNSLNDIKALEEYCKDKLHYEKPSIRLCRIKMNSLVKRNGYFVTLNGRTGMQIYASNAVQLIMDKKHQDYVHLLDKYSGINDSEYLKRNNISKESNEEIYQYLVEKLNNKIYDNRPASILSKLKSKYNVFKELELSEQNYVLKQIVLYFSRANISIDLKLLNEKSSPMKISNTVSNEKEFILINQSVTGLFKNEINLLTI